jgi:hypothetical protein
MLPPMIFPKAPTPATIKPAVAIPAIIFFLFFIF